MTRKGVTVLTALIITIGFLAPSAPASAATGNTGDTSQITAHRTADLVVPPVARAGGSSLAPGSTPPMGACTWRVHVKVTSNYANHLLEDTKSAYDSSSTCTTTAPGQTMDGMTLQMELMINSLVRKRSDQVACHNFRPSDAACLALSDSDTSFCLVLGQRCDGVYHGVTWVEFLLPDGWFYLSTPKGCTSLGGGQELICQLLTTPVVVSPTI
jgi:hypothetical protein